MKKYKEPIVSIIRISSEDVISLSEYEGEVDWGTNSTSIEPLS